MSKALLLTVQEAAEVLRLSRSKVYELVAAGVLPSLTIDRSRRIPADALPRWIEERARAERASNRDREGDAQNGQP